MALQIKLPELIPLTNNISTYIKYKGGYEHFIPKLTNSIKFVQKIIDVYSYPEDEFVRTLDQRVELRRNIIKVIDMDG